MVMCNGMGRGGSTLQYNLVRSLLDATVGCVTHGYIAQSEGHNHFVPLDELFGWATACEHHVVKIHNVHPDLRSLVQEGRTSVCYIYRDLRDVAVSRQVAFGEKGEILLAALRESEGQYYELRDLRAEFSDHFLWHRYEDTTHDLVGAVDDAAKLLALALPARRQLLFPFSDN